MLGKTETILVIDEEVSIRESFKDYLEVQGYHVLQAENGRIGLEIFERERPDLVLTDLRMPEVDGLDVLRCASELSPETPLIVISGTGHLGDSIQAMKLGAWDYILKPVADMAIVTIAINRTMEKAHLRRENLAYQKNIEVLVQERTSELEEANTHLVNINERLKKVVETTRELSVCSNMARFGSTLLDEFARHMLASGGSLFWVEDKGVRRLHTLEPDHVPEFIPHPLPEGSVLSRVIEEEKPLLIQDIDQDKEIKSSGWKGYRDSSVLAFPLPDEFGRVVGILTLHSKNDPPFVEQDKEIGSILASCGSETLRTAGYMESLRVSERRFKELAEMLPEAVFETNGDMKLTYANQKAFELFGYSTEDISRGFNVLILIALEDRKKAMETAVRRLSGNETPSIEYNALRKDGTVFPIYLRMNTIKKRGRIVGFRGVVVDITERKQAERNLLYLRNYLKNIINSMPSILIGVDNDGRVTQWNNEAQRATGIAVKDALKLSLPQAFPRLSAKMDLVRQAIQSRKIQTDLRQVWKEDGESRYEDITVFPLLADKIEGAVIRVDDVTDQARIEEMMVQSEKMMSVGGLAAGMAHEINNPLGAILQGAQNMERRLSSDFNRNVQVAKKYDLNFDSLKGYLEERQIYDFLKGIRESGQRAAKIIRDMLRFSRKSESQFAWVEITEILEDALKLAGQDYDLKKEYDFKFIKIEKEYEPLLETVPCVRTEIEQVLLNLLKNSAQAIREHKSGIDPKIILRSLIDGKMARIEIEDNGSGMNEATRKRIFEPFFTTKPIGRGTGLGLSVSYMIIANNHKGSMEVKSELGKYTRFIIRLPFERDDILPAFRS